MLRFLILLTLSFFFSKPTYAGELQYQHLAIERVEGRSSWLTGWFYNSSDEELRDPQITVDILAGQTVITTLMLSRGRLARHSHWQIFEPLPPESTGYRLIPTLDTLWVRP